MVAKPPVLSCIFKTPSPSKSGMCILVKVKHFQVWGKRRDKVLDGEKYYTSRLGLRKKRNVKIIYTMISFVVKKKEKILVKKDRRSKTWSNTH